MANILEYKVIKRQPHSDGLRIVYLFSDNDGLSFACAISASDVDFEEGTILKNDFATKWHDGNGQVFHFDPSVNCTRRAEAESRFEGLLGE